ncbi:MAG TPA: class I SAM-dependent methyltransferase [Prosthecobacter sp.]|nr:class I SAM-dependent methyltransferase [Prosthecobacter sp.]
MSVLLSPGSSSTPLAVTRSFDLRVFDHVFQTLIAQGGPHPSEYAAVSRVLRQLGDAVRAGVVAPAAALTYAHTLTQRSFQGTMQAEALARKYGYSGDFEIIDHIYTQKINPAPHLRAWDLYFHAQSAPSAVRNRKAYFQRLMQAHVAVNSRSEPLAVLNVASGPGRDLCEFFQNHPAAAVEVDCVEVDARAIAYAQDLCSRWTDRIRFHHRNVLRFVPGHAYDLVWSAGLFDYLNERLFVHLLKALIAVVRKGGEVVIGNFSDYNPSRDYMELMGNWHLQHRSRETLIRLATEAGAPLDSVQVLWEPEGVNFFLHIQR